MQGCHHSGQEFYPKFVSIGFSGPQIFFFYILVTVLVLYSPVRIRHTNFCARVAGDGSGRR